MLTRNSFLELFRDAYLRHWLVNLTGRVNGFKEVDLLQEHQNFWAKVCDIDQGDECHTKDLQDNLLCPWVQ